MTTSKIFNRTISVFAAFLVLLCSMTLYSDNSRAANTARGYTVFSPSTGQEIPDAGYTLSALSARQNRSTINQDNRVVDWSKSGVVKLITYGGNSTGFVVDDHTIATAAHCVYSVENQSAYKIIDVDLFTSDGELSLQATPVEIHVPDLYIYGKGTNEYDPYYDYALITIKEDLSDYACFNLGLPLDSILETNPTIYSTGFPSYVGGNQVNAQFVHNMYTATGNIVHLGQEDFQLETTAVTTSGASGSPMYITENRYNYTYHTVIGIFSSGGSTYFGTRMTTDLIHFYLNNGHLNYETEE